MEDIEDWGSVIVNEKCVGCMTCRVLSPEIFIEAKVVDPTSKVISAAARPLKSKEEYMHVRKAVVACPFKAIRWISRPPVKGLPPIDDEYPQKIEDNVYLCGLPSAELFGGASYLILLPEGNIMFDNPDPKPALVEKIKALGGIRYFVYSHKDHVGLHPQWKAAFPEAQRVMHEDDLVKKDGFFPSCMDFEIIIKRSEPTSKLPGVDDLVLLHLPGHTPGSIFMLYKDKFLFTGDSLCYSRASGHLVGVRLQCWQDWQLLGRSVAKLKDYSFQYVLAGHGESHRFDSSEAAQSSLALCLQDFGKQPSGHTPLFRFIMWVEVRTKVKNGVMHFLADWVALPPGSRATIPAYTEAMQWDYGALVLGMVALLAAGTVGALATRSSKR